MKTQITCKQAVDFISKKEEGKLSLRQRVQLVRHLAICSLCRIFNQQNKIIVKALSRKRKVNGLTPDERAAIAENVLKQS